ncbi:uncharacterized protein LOC112542952 [Python bivittatus]|uniref:Uncharacterized protein LOC112542952 n=1 Tax=Python bivittatus TaxID=176946 RepID=A0A9F5J9B9_PYTBI|nr:uncharacterized protein LOC112542952 [Python bivittatus]
MGFDLSVTGLSRRHLLPSPVAAGTSGGEGSASPHALRAPTTAEEEEEEEGEEDAFSAQPHGPQQPKRKQHGRARREGAGRSSRLTSNPQKAGAPPPWRRHAHLLPPPGAGEGTVGTAPATSQLRPARRLRRGDFRELAAAASASVWPSAYSAPERAFSASFFPRRPLGRFSWERREQLTERRLLARRPVFPPCGRRALSRKPRATRSNPPMRALRRGATLTPHRALPKEGAKFFWFSIDKVRDVLLENGRYMLKMTLWKLAGFLLL